MTTTTTVPGTKVGAATNASSTAVASNTAQGTGTRGRAARSHDDTGLRLAALRDLKSVTLRGIPDVRGWNVEIRDGVMIGQVARILVDQKARHAVRYLDVRVEPTRFAMAGEPFHTLVPIGRVQLAADRDVVLLPSLGKDQVSSLLPLGDAPIEFTFEANVAKRFGSTQPVTNFDELYRGDLFTTDSAMTLRRTAS